MIEPARLRALLLLTLAAALAGGLISLSDEVSRDRIAANQRTRLLANVRDVLGTTRFDNDSDISQLPFTPKGDAPVEVFRAERDGVTVANVFAVTSPNGYNGPIELLVGIASNGMVTGVRVLSHRETPGLGDGIERRRSDWIDTFVGTRLGAPPLGAWKVSKDGGHFDALTGATVTPRAVVDAVRTTLLYQRDHAAELGADADVGR